MDLGFFFHKYFVEPIITGSGYNIYNTIVYAIIFVLISYGIYKMLIKLKIDIDRNFAIGILPYIVLGGILRALQDKYQITYFFVTPLIYFVIFIIALPSLLLFRRLWKKKYYKGWALFGLALCVFGIIPMKFVRFEALLLVLLISFAWFLVFYGIKKFVKVEEIQNFLNQENIGLLLAHSFDATTTFVSLQFYPYFEQHVLGSIFVNFFGPIGMYILKIPIILVVLYFLDKELKAKRERNLRNLIKIAILLLGLAPGLRNFLRLGMGV